MIALVFFCACVICGLLLIYPFIIYPATLKIFPRRPLIRKSSPHPRLAICVCAYNEAGIIEEKAKNLRALQDRYPGLEVLIYIDCATDETAQILKSYQDHFYLHISPQRHGKTHGMNLLVQKTSADIIVFSDANVMLDLSSLENLIPYFSDENVGCVCGHLKYLNTETATAANGSLYWRLEEYIKQRESDTGSIVGADGSIFAIRRALHHPPPDDIIDDMYVSLMILCHGYRVVRAPDVIAYEQSIGHSNEEFNRKIRIACQAFNVHRMLWPRLRQLDTLNLYKYLTHKYIRWFAAFWLAFSVIFFNLWLISIGFGGLGLTLTFLAFGILIFGHILQLKPVIIINDILFAFLGTALGIIKSIKGERFKTWTPAASIRRIKQ
jgi:cellulose synthase/poly-beta-1,6-N-acetylglucosamine synthase-like glycosyltransferase